MCLKVPKAQDGNPEGLGEIKFGLVGDTTNMYLPTGYDRLRALLVIGMILALARVDDEIAKAGNTGNPISLLSNVVCVVFIVVPAASGST
jgi:hypothetical protein